MGTPVKVPSAAGSYTTATQDPDLRSQINACLLQNGHAAKIQESLLHSLHSHPSNWPTAVQSHAVSLLRSGEVSTFPALLRRVLDDIRQDTLANFSKTTVSNGLEIEAASASTSINGTINGNTASRTNGLEAGAQGGLAVPLGVVEDALKVTRESMESICEFESS